MSRIGIMGGTFDPIHNGHLELARRVATELDLDKVIFIPTGNPSFKQDIEVTSAEDRVRMVELALSGQQDFILDRCEVDRPGVTYSVDTLEDLHARYMQAELFFIMGSDVAATVSHWKDAERVARLCTFVVVSRRGAFGSDDDGRPDSLPLPTGAIRLEIDIPELSSTDLRQRFSCGQTLAALLPPAVIEYIETRHLYRGDVV